MRSFCATVYKDTDKAKLLGEISALAYDTDSSEFLLLLSGPFRLLAAISLLFSRNVATRLSVYRV